MFKKTGKAIAGFGVRRFLTILGSMSALVGATCAYGPAPAYGMPSCTTDDECRDMGAGWYCEKSSGTGYCAQAEPDAGTSEDAGQ